MDKTINVITLGCSKNTVDSERIMAQLFAGGWDVKHDADEPAEVVVINTCGFIGDAKEESVEMILRWAEAKTRGLISRLYVIGCLSERYRDELKNEIPEVDSFFGARDLTEVVRELNSNWVSKLSTRRLLSTPKHYAYLKISEGCDRACGFCAIPSIRGKHISVPIEELIEEAHYLAEAGVKELMVIAQDTTCYGIDIYGERKLAELLERLCEVEGIEWIRLHYAYPAGFPRDVIEVMAREPKICKYLDIPLQHISDSQLASMKRGAGRTETEKLISELREKVPGIAIRTTLMTGYPGETDEDFGELCEFVRTAGFERLGIFKYSEEEGTWAARNLGDNITEDVKEERAHKVMEIQQSVVYEINRSKVGSILRAIVDGRQEDYLLARSEYDSPEVDQEILVEIKGLEKIPGPGEFVDIKITSAGDYELYGRLCG